jgi:phosphotransferase system IIA component
LTIPAHEQGARNTSETKGGEEVPFHIGIDEVELYLGKIG